MTTPTQRQSDRAAYHEAVRAAAAMRADASKWTAIINLVEAPPAVYGPDGKDYRDGVQARLEVVANWCLHLADKQDEIADSYRHLLGVA